MNEIAAYAIYTHSSLTKIANHKIRQNRWLFAISTNCHFSGLLVIMYKTITFTIHSLLIFLELKKTIDTLLLVKNIIATEKIKTATD